MMPSFIVNNHWKWKIFPVITMLLLVIYLLLVNYSLPYLTWDELQHVFQPIEWQFGHNLSSTRISHLISNSLNHYLLQFLEPSINQLTPRFMTMVLLVSSLYCVLRRFKVEPRWAIIVAVFTVMSHQLDSQHNGLIAFFGDYNLALACFFLALILHERARSSAITSLLVFLLTTISFLSELFVGLSVLFLLVLFIKQLSGKSIGKSPIFWAILVYMFAYLVVRYTFGLQEKIVFVNRYLFGSTEMHGVYDVAQASSLYFINSLPYYNSLPIPARFSIWLAVILSGIIIVFSVLVVRRFLTGSGCEDCYGKIDSEVLPVFVVLVALVFVPPLLLSMQPMKYEWIMTGASTRYAFSLYVWISIVIISTVSYLFFIPKKNYTKAIIAILLTLYCANSVVGNLSFVRLYEESLENWSSIHRIIKESDATSVKIPASLLHHPFNSGVSAVAIKKLALNVYGRKAEICYGVKGYDFALPEKLIGLDLIGFHDPENQGRWTSGRFAQISLHRELEKGDIVELIITGVFAENSRLPVKFEVGDLTVSRIIRNSCVVRIGIAQYLKNPILSIYIPKPTSPLSVGVSGDSRTIGIMIKKIRFLRTGEDGREQDLVEGCY